MLHALRFVRLFLLGVLVAALTAGTCGPPPPGFSNSNSTNSTTGDATSQPSQTTDTTMDQNNQSSDATASNKVRIVVQDFGNIDITLFPEEAPLTVAAFLGLVDEGFYDNTLVHRVVRGFVIQAGAFDADRNPLPDRNNVPNESDNGLSNVQGTVATALLPNQPDSFATSFFINTVDNDGSGVTSDLDAAGHTVFGRVDAGFDVVQAIEAVPVTNQTPDDPPLIVSISRLASP